MRFLFVLNVLFWPLEGLLAMEFPDTGLQHCWNENQRAIELCNDDNTGDSSVHPGQDGRFGRDAAARQGALEKVGGGEAGFDYTKVCNSGELAGEGTCPTDPSLGPGADDWGCTLDNLTGLMWEVKVDDVNHLRHKAWTYTWYNTDGSHNGGNPGVADTGVGVGSDNCLNPARCDTEKYVADVNAVGLCGYTDWRLPYPMEIITLPNFGRLTTPKIDTAYFPNVAVNTDNFSVYWLRVFSGSSAWAFDFKYAFLLTRGPETYHFIRLVRPANQ